MQAYIIPKFVLEDSFSSNVGQKFNTGSTTYLVKFAQTLQPPHLDTLLKLLKADDTFRRASPFVHTVLFGGMISDHSTYSSPLAAHSLERIVIAVADRRTLTTPSFAAR